MGERLRHRDAPVRRKARQDGTKIVRRPDVGGSCPLQLAAQFREQRSLLRFEAAEAEKHSASRGAGSGRHGLIGVADADFPELALFGGELIDCIRRFGLDFGGPQHQVDEIDIAALDRRLLGMEQAAPDPDDPGVAPRQLVPDHCLWQVSAIDDPDHRGLVMARQQPARDREALGTEFRIVATDHPARDLEQRAQAGDAHQMAQPDRGRGIEGHIGGLTAGGRNWHRDPVAVLKLHVARLSRVDEIVWRLPGR